MITYHISSWEKRCECAGKCLGFIIKVVGTTQKKHLQLCPKHSRYRFSVVGGDKNRRDFPFLAGYVHEMC
jgi:hypothetical protein